MIENPSSRRKFLQFLGLSAGATLIGPVAIANFTETAEIRKLNPEQQEFMIRYGDWMDEFTEVIRDQKSNPGNIDNHKKMMALTEIAESFKPELSKFMQDETFALIYTASIERMSNEI